MGHFQKHIAEKTDEELRAMFCYLFAPGVIRANVRFIHNRLNNLPDDHEPDENIEEIKDDEECPYDTFDDEEQTAE